MAGLLFALGTHEGWAEEVTRRLAPTLVHYPWLETRTFSEGCFSLALVLHRDVEPPVWDVGASPHVVVFGEYHDSGAAELRAAATAGDWARLRNRNGVYDLVAWDAGRRRLAVATDVTGALVLFRATYERGWIWSSEPGALAATSALDHEGLRSLLRIGYQAGLRTAEAGVVVVSPATTEVATVLRNEIVLRSESSLPEPERTPRFEQAYLELVRDAVDLRLAAAPSAELPLTGGLDSRLLLAAAVERGHELRTFTLDGVHHRDVAVAARVAATLSVPHRVVPAKPSAAHEHLSLLRGAIHTTADWHPAAYLPVCGLLAPGRPLVLGYLGGTLAGAFVHPTSAEAGLSALRRQALAPYAAPCGTSLDWCHLPADGIPAPAELLVNLFGRQRRYTSYLVRLAWNFGCPISPYADVRLIRLALGASRRELAGQRARLRGVARAFPALAALPSANDGLPIRAPVRRALRDAARRHGLGRRVRAVYPRVAPRFDYANLAPLAREIRALVPEEDAYLLPPDLPPMATLAAAPVLVTTRDRAARDLVESLLHR
jgi:asparagine synthase